MKTCWFVATLLTALLLGTSFSHTLELPAKMQYDAALYLTLQKTLYAEWGPPKIGGFLEPGALLAVVLQTYLLRRRRPAMYLALAATVMLLLAFPLVFFMIIEPANMAFRQASTQYLPPDWMIWRIRWEYGHLARFALHFTAFCLLVLSLLASRKTRRREIVR